MDQIIVELIDSCYSKQSNHIIKVKCVIKYWILFQWILYLNNHFVLCEEKENLKEIRIIMLITFWHDLEQFTTMIWIWYNYSTATARNKNNTNIGIEQREKCVYRIYVYTIFYAINTSWLATWAWRVWLFALSERVETGLISSIYCQLLFVSTRFHLQFIFVRHTCTHKHAIQRLRRIIWH